MHAERWRVGLLGWALLGASIGGRADTAASVEVGTRDGAAYRIDVPANWNRELVVYYHGYSITPVTFAAGEPPSPMFAPLLRAGYAVVQSGYSATGWAVAEADADTEKLRRDFVAWHGAPRRSYAMGMSMGGTLTVLTIERRPNVYNGALALCGAIEPSDHALQRLFALRAAFDHYVPDLLGPLVPVPADYRADAATERRIAAALAARPDARQALLRWYGAADADNLAPVIAFGSYVIGELQRRAHGNPFANADLVYLGSGDDAALDAGVRRYRADPAAAAYLARWYTPSGRLTRPLLALHDSGDPLVPASGAAEYALLAQRAGHADNFVLQYIDREGHCVFTPEEIGRAFDALVAWVASGRRPADGKVP